MESFILLAKKYEEKLIENRRWLHQHPEVGNYLSETSTYVKKELDEMGYTPKFYSGCTGMSVTVGSGGKCFLIRADMDGLPLEEETDLPFASKNGNAHACGHDIHTAILLAIARILKEKENELKGTIKLMFQTGEESAHGCEKMVQAGILEDPKVDAALALHTKPNYENGTLHYIKGIASSSTDVFTIKLEGEAAHGSTPEKAIDPLFAAANIYMALNGLVGRELSAFSSAVLSIGMLAGGSAANIIPENAELRGTIRCYEEGDRNRILDRMNTIVRCESEMARTKYEMEVLSTPSCYNTPALCEEIVPYLSSVIGPGNMVEERLPAPGSEDFSIITKEVPSMLFWYGTGDENNYALHNPKVVMREDKLYKAAAAMAYTAYSWVNK